MCRNRILQRRSLSLRRVAQRQILFRRSAIHAERFLLYMKCNAISYKAKSKKKALRRLGVDQISEELSFLLLTKNYKILFYFVSSIMISLVRARNSVIRS